MVGKQRNAGKVEEWKTGWVECWMNGRMDGWMGRRIGEREERREKMESWKNRILEDWMIGEKKTPLLLTPRRFFTSFVPRITNNVLYILNDYQKGCNGMAHDNRVK